MTAQEEAGRLGCIRGGGTPEPNPPAWPGDGSVLVVRPGDGVEVTQRRLAEAVQDPWDGPAKTFTSERHFSPRRRAALFAPGSYRCRFQVGYYAQVLGLGRSPDDVRFCLPPSGDARYSDGGGATEDEAAANAAGPYVTALNRHLDRSGRGTCLDTFWRSAENLSVGGGADLVWAASQASPLRRVRVSDGGDLVLHDGPAHASGGHVADSAVSGAVRAGGQQQLLFRNVRLGRGASGGAWSMVYVGCAGQVPAASPGGGVGPAVTVVERPRVQMAKPYLCLKDDATRYELRVPAPIYFDRGPSGSLDGVGSGERVLDFARVRVVRPCDPVGSIQEALDQAKSVVLSPGLYPLKDPVEIRTAGQVVLGLGLATLIAPASGGPCLRVAPGVPGVVVAGVMLEASERDSAVAPRSDQVSSLLEWGEPGVCDPGVRESPGGLIDVFCRVGGPLRAGRRAGVSLDVMVRIHSGHVIGDNLWLWRADHAELAPGEAPNYPDLVSSIYWQTEEQEYRVGTGLQVFGDDVTISGLAVEHANGHQVVWSGERGSVYFYQCELPYCVDHSFARTGFRGYLIDRSVSVHEVYAPGIYTNFRNEAVQVATAIEQPDRDQIRVVNPYTVKLDNKGGCLSVLNGVGQETTKQGVPARIV